MMDIYKNHYCEKEKTYCDIYGGVCEIVIIHSKEHEQSLSCKHCQYFVTGTVAIKTFRDAKRYYYDRVE
jgi:hypothetical protein